jgi:hypothetical protein
MVTRIVTEATAAGVPGALELIRGGFLEPHDPRSQPFSRHPGPRWVSSEPASAPPMSLGSATTDGGAPGDPRRGRDSP